MVGSLPMMLRTRRTLSLLAVLALSAPPPSAAGQASAEERGTVATGLLLRQLDGVKRVLMIAAHPDDEDTSLLAELARGWGAETAYLALTRGEGGQNVIGQELEEGLGIVRTGELLAARSVDGGRQFFTRAFDYGYSRSAEEALTLWPDRALLRDVVWVVRSFRPQVIVSVFSGTPSDGHGQHQAAGIMAHRVFDAAADPDLYPEQFARGVGPWRVEKLYRASFFSPQDATSTLETGAYDPLLGRSRYQVAMLSRSQHRSQEMGTAAGLGPQESSLILVRARDVPQEGDGKASLLALEAGGFFAGVDTSIVSLADRVDAGRRADLRSALERYRTAIGEARSALDPYQPASAAPALARALATIGEAQTIAGASNPDVTRTLSARHKRVSEALATALGVVVDIRASDDLVVPGEPFRLDLELWNGGPRALDGARVTLMLPEGAQVVETEPPAPRRRFFGPQAPEATGPADGSVWRVPEPLVAETVAPGALKRWSYWVRLDAATPPTRLYYLRTERGGAMYDWPQSTELWGLPRDPDPLAATVALEVDGVTAELDHDVRYRRIERAGGEFSEPVLVVPAVSVEVDAQTLVWPAGSTAPRQLNVTLRSAAREGVQGRLELELPSGFRAEPASRDFALAGDGATASYAFELLSNGPPPPGRHVVRATAFVGERRYDEGLTLVDYEHIQRTPLYRAARTEIRVFSVALADNLSVGYVMGSGDAGPAAIRQLGVEPVLLDRAALASGDLARFDVIVVGVRAYETRADLRAHNDRLLAFARAGGTLVVQYNQYDFPRGGYAPYPVDISRPHDRVTDERAEVRLLEPDHPLFNAPNGIGQEDFDGWIQERSLYELGSWDDRYLPLIEMSDAGREPTRGSLLVAPLDRGLYVYTGLALFRQLPKGVPGAYRLFANLLSLRARGVS